jgi:hypothetical protein
MKNPYAMSIEVNHLGAKQPAKIAAQKGALSTVVFRKTVHTPTGDVHPEIVVSGPSASIAEVFDALHQSMSSWAETDTL